MYPSVRNFEKPIATTVKNLTTSKVDLLIRIKVVHLASRSFGFDFENFGAHMVEIQHENN